MPPTTGDNETSYTTLSTQGKLFLPPFPHEDAVLSHEANKCYERAVRELTAAGMLRVALDADVPDLVDDIRDRLVHPALPASHAHHYRREESRLDAMEFNKGQHAKRVKLWLESWTTLHTACLDCTEKSAPGLHRVLHDTCPMTPFDPSYIDRRDGPRAFKTYTTHRVKTAIWNSLRSQPTYPLAAASSGSSSSLCATSVIVASSSHRHKHKTWGE